MPECAKGGSQTPCARCAKGGVWKRGDSTEAGSYRFRRESKILPGREEGTKFLDLGVDSDYTNGPEVWHCGFPRFAASRHVVFDDVSGKEPWSQQMLGAAT